MAVFTKGWIDQRLQYLQQCLLDQAVDHRGYPQLTLASIRLREADATHRTRPVLAFHQLLSDVRPRRPQLTPGLSYIHPIHSCCTFVRLHAFPRAQHVLSRKRLC